jgi:hypothetical protein
MMTVGNKLDFGFDKDLTEQPDEVFEIGKRARLDGKTLNDNPYPVYSMLAEAWGNGWVSGDEWMKKYKGERK